MGDRIITSKTTSPNGITVETGIDLDPRIGPYATVSIHGNYDSHKALNPTPEEIKKTREAIFKTQGEDATQTLMETARGKVPAEHVEALSKLLHADLKLPQLPPDFRAKGASLEIK